MLLSLNHSQLSTSYDEKRKTQQRQGSVGSTSNDDSEDAKTQKNVSVLAV